MLKLSKGKQESRSHHDCHVVLEKTLMRKRYNTLDLFISTSVVEFFVVDSVTVVTAINWLIAMIDSVTVVAAINWLIAMIDSVTVVAAINWLSAMMV